ncbi:MAG: dipeptide ABC transporter ATP-binding protein [Neisseria sp.]|nr:dipeptide ABC transporter ATP-binding protein [Neisseria sp.]
MQETMLRIQNLNAFFGDKQVLHDISLDIKRGRKTAVVGESGSGKTVLAQSIIRLNPDVRLTGGILLDGQNVLELSERGLRALRGKKVGMVFQEPMTALNPVMKTGRQIAEAAALHLGLNRREAWQTAVARLRETGIEPAEEKAAAYPFQLSGGQRQRAMIAAAVAAEPELLIADEPTTALDAAVQAQILDLLNQLQQARGMTLLYITHDLNLVRRFADDVIVMQHGRVVEQGSVEAVFRRPQHAYTKMLLESGTLHIARPSENRTANAPVLQAQQLACSVYEKSGWFKTREKVLLHPVSFSLNAGETLGIIGESGSGKTTLAKSLLGLNAHTGSVEIHGKPFGKTTRRAVQMVFQDPFGAFNPRMNIFEALAEGLDVHEPQLGREEKRARVAEALAAVAMPDDILERYPHEFSGGQRQRLAIARALVMRPEVLVLDEPTSALDAQNRRQILALLAKLQAERGLAMMLISHDLAVIRALSQRVMVLHRGRVVEEGACEKVFAAPNHEYTKKLLFHAHP